MKKAAIIAIAVLLFAPATVSASKFTASKIGEQIVEGHTVFTVLQKKSVEQGFDIVIKVREVRRGPNVLWFNDQWKTFFEDVRQPCGGYVLATYTGVDPTSLLSQATIGLNGATQPLGLGITYVESYHITDPNGAVWDTDLYAITGVYGRTIPIWISTVLNSGGPDDGVSDCDGILDLALHDDPGEQTGPNGEDVYYYDNLDSLNATGVPIREYNADIFGLWKDVLPEGTKHHGDGGLDDSDGTGCEVDTEWECTYRGPDNQAHTADDDDVNGNDDAEGNSHPYNPYQTGSGYRHTHETSRLDVFFFSDFGPFNLGLFNAVGGYPPNPRNYAVYDVEQVESEEHPCNVVWTGPTPGSGTKIYGFYNHSIQRPATECGLGSVDGP